MFDQDTTQMRDAWNDQVSVTSVSSHPWFPLLQPPDPRPKQTHSFLHTCSPFLLISPQHTPATFPLSSTRSSQNWHAGVPATCLFFLSPVYLFPYLPVCYLPLPDIWTLDNLPQAQLDFCLPCLNFWCLNVKPDLFDRHLGLFAKLLL